MRLSDFVTSGNAASSDTGSVSIGRTETSSSPGLTSRFQGYIGGNILSRRILGNGDCDYVALCRKSGGAESEACEAFGRHKMFLVDPNVIPKGIRWAEVRQEEGDAMIVFPRVVHYGFNYGCVTSP